MKRNEDAYKAQQEKLAEEQKLSAAEKQRLDAVYKAQTESSQAYLAEQAEEAK